MTLTTKLMAAVAVVLCGWMAGWQLWHQDADKTTTNQRVKELRFSLQKLERLKDVHDATLREAATNQGEIREMVEKLGVTR